MTARRAATALHATEHALAARSSLYAETTGPPPREAPFAAVAGAAAWRCLEVGCGRRWSSRRVARELAASVVAVDQSGPMVELALAEVAQVLRRGGRLVATANGRERPLELRRVVGVAEAPYAGADTALDDLRSHFVRLEARDVGAPSPSRIGVRSSGTCGRRRSRLRSRGAYRPDVRLPLVARRFTVVLVAHKP